MPVCAPHVTIAGQPLPESWTPGESAALDGIKIVFGTDSVFERIDPAKLTLRVIDPDGVWSTTPDLIGSEVQITIEPDQRRIFRGFVRRVSSKLQRLSDPETDSVQDVFISELVAYDPLSLADGDHSEGPTPGDASMNHLRWGYGGAGWVIQQVEQRLRAVGIADRVHAISSNRIFAPYEQADLPSLLEVLNDAYGTDGYVCAWYDPEDNSISHTEWPEWSIKVGSWALRMIDDRITLAPTGSAAADSWHQVLRADKVELPSGITIDSDSTYRIAQVSASYWQLTLGTSDGQSRWTPKEYISQRTVPGGDQKASAQLKLESRWIFAPDNSDSNSLPINVTWLAAFNGRIKHPTIRIRPDRNPAYWTADRLRGVLLSRPSNMYTFFAGSFLNAFPSGGPTWIIRGGTLTYEQGWQLDLDLIPNADRPVTPITIAQVCQAAAPTYSQFDPDLAWVDFNQISQGVPA